MGWRTELCWPKRADISLSWTASRSVPGYSQLRIREAHGFNLNWNSRSLKLNVGVYRMLRLRMRALYKSVQSVWTETQPTGTACFLVNYKNSSVRWPLSFSRSCTRWIKFAPNASCNVSFDVPYAALAWWSVWTVTLFLVSKFLFTNWCTRELL